MRLLTIICLIFALLSTAHAYQAPAYFGMDAQLSCIPFEKQYGGQIAPRAIPGINPFVGINVTPYIALELGYQYGRAVRTSTLGPNDYAAGFPMPALITPITFKSTIALEGPSITVVLMTPVLEKAPIQFFWGAGISQTRVTVTRKTMQFSEYVGVNTRVLESCRTIGKLTAVGGNYFFNPDFAIRGSVMLSNTKRLHQFVCSSYYPYIKQQMKAKNGLTYSIGLRWGF